MDKLKIRLGAAVLGLFFSLLIAEVIVRVFFPYSRDHVIPGRLFQMDTELGWSFRKDHHSRHKTSTFDVEYRINNLGYRDIDRTVEKKPGVKRVLLYGDSQAFGWGLAQKERFSDLLENRLKDVEVWNLAVPAYGLDQELLSFERSGKQYSPDIVIMLTSQSTLGRTRYGYNYRKHKPQFVLDATGNLTLIPVPKTGRIINELLYESIGWLYLPYFVETRLEIIKSRFRTEQPRQRKADPLREINKHILSRAKATVEKTGAELVVIGSLPDIKAAQLKAFSTTNGIHFIDYQLPTSNDSWILSATDHHYNPRASIEIANQIEPRLRQLLFTTTPTSPR